MTQRYIGTIVKGHFADLEDLAIIDIEPTSEAEPGEWANEILDRIRSEGTYLNAPDYDGTYAGDSNGISVLIERADWPVWYQAARSAACVITAEHDAHTGHYGDGNWDGVDIVRVAIDDETEPVYLWLERHCLPARQTANTTRQEVTMARARQYIGATVKGQFADLEDLLLLDIEPISETESVDEWANEILDAMRGHLSAPDYDGTYSGRTNGISVLIERSDRAAWYQAARSVGCVVTAEYDADTGYYGDGNWRGVDIVRADIDYPESETVYLWIER